MNCRVCGSELPDGALFCGECGSSVTATLLRRSAAEDSRPSDTTIIEPLPKPAVVGPRSTVHSVPVPMPAVTSEVADAADDTDAADAVDAVDAVRSAPVAPPVPDVAPTVEPVMAPTGVTFTLDVSTGERVLVTGSGLLGRRPIAQPGEMFDQLVSIADAGRSVSKTHLEFGVDAGQLWVCDRYSANGTVVVPIDAPSRVCEPGRRYRVARGSRVELGDQSFHVS
jgi:hypothetical protein